MSRIRIVAALAATLSLAGASVAQAASSHITGGTTQITASSAAATLLANNHITVTPIAPATASGATFTFPISGGTLNPTTLHGVIFHKGGLTVSNGTKSVSLRRPTLVSSKAGVSIYALVRGRVERSCHRLGRHGLRLRCHVIVRLNTARIARVTNASVSGGKATGTVNITAFTADLINRLAGKKVATAGDVLGTGTVAPTLAP
jgi:hypothetical protein